jgi:hypothetical protein
MSEADVKRLQERFSKDAQMQVQRDTNGKPTAIVVRAQPGIHSTINEIIRFMNPSATAAQRVPSDGWAEHPTPSQLATPQNGNGTTPARQVQEVPVPVDNNYLKLGFFDLARRQVQEVPEPVDRAMRQVQAAKTDEERQAAKNGLRMVLVEVFVKDMQLRKVETLRIEERLAKLKAQHEARLSAREQIIDLQMKVLEHDAAGLGFPGPQSRTSHQPQSPLWSGKPEPLMFTPTKERSPLDDFGAGQRGKNPVAPIQLPPDEVKKLRPDTINDQVEISRSTNSSLAASLPSDHVELLARLRKATAAVAEHQADWNQAIKEGQISDPPVSVEELQKRYPAAWKNLETARSELIAEQRLREATVKLLELQRQKAETGVGVAHEKLTVTKDLQAKNLKSAEDVRVHEGKLRAAQLEVDQIGIVLDLLR